MKLLFGLFCFFIANVAMAASVESSSKQVIELQRLNDKSALMISKLESQVGELKLQNQLIQSYQDRMSNTVYWALGVVAGIFALLMSYSVFTNFKFYEQDKLKFKDELRGLIDIFKAELLVRFEQDRGELERSVESRSESNVKMVLQQGTESRLKIENVRSELLEAIDAVKLKEASLTEGLISVRRVVSAQAAQFYGVEEMVWALKNNPACIIITQSQALDAAVSSGSEYFVSATLNRLSAALTKHYIDGQSVLGSSEYKTIEEMISRAGAREPQLIHEIREKLQLCTHEKDVETSNVDE